MTILSKEKHNTNLITQQLKTKFDFEIEFDGLDAFRLTFRFRFPMEMAISRKCTPQDNNFYISKQKLSIIKM